MKYEMTAKDESHYQRFAILLIVWVVAFAVSTIVLKKGWIESRSLQYAVAILPTVLLAFVIISYIRFIRNADELLRKIHVEALGWGFGAGILFSMGYRLLERTGIPNLDINDPVIVMSLFWSLGLWHGIRRYA